MPSNVVPLSRPAPPWTVDHGLGAVIERWMRNGTARQFVLDESSTPTAADRTPVPDSLGATLRGALRDRGIDELYQHQRQALLHTQAGRDVVIATPTASGKSLCYNLPIMDALGRDPSTRALFLFPTKALCRDQEVALQSLLSDAGVRAPAVTYDGDTPPDARRAARQRASVILTNPDMLHTAILPHHTLWAGLFAGLKYVVVDELHAYRGVFGSHLANVLRRLRRIARFHGADPQFVLCSATIGNPQEHASRMSGRDGAARDEVKFLSF